MILCEEKWKCYNNDSKNNKMKNEYFVSMKNFFCDDIKTKSLFGDECKEIQNRAGDSYLSTVVTCAFRDVFKTLEWRVNKQELPTSSFVYIFNDFPQLFCIFRQPDYVETT